MLQWVQFAHGYFGSNIHWISSSGKTKNKMGKDWYRWIIIPKLKNMLMKKKDVLWWKFSLYGLIQSTALQFNVRTSFLSNIGFKSNTYDHCVMRINIKYGTMILILYVDDILVFSDDERDNYWFIHRLEQ